MKKALFWAAATAAVLGLAAQPAAADEIVVKMLNKGSDGKMMVFEPDFVRAKVGDTIKFMPVDNGHIAMALPEVWPEGVDPVKGQINTELDFTPAKEGIYGFKCLPHFPMGMVMLVQVGSAPIPDAVAKLSLPNETGKRFAAELAKAAAP